MSGRAFVGAMIVCPAFVFWSIPAEDLHGDAAGRADRRPRIFERVRILRVPMVIGGIALFNLFAVGSAIIRPLGDFVRAWASTRPSPTGPMSGAWPSAIAENPLVGYGMKGFWQTSQPVNGGGAVETTWRRPMPIIPISG